MIGNANLRDVTFILANLREHDRQEIDCQLPDGYSKTALAENLILTSEARVAYLHGQPVMVFGTTPVTVCCMSLWAMGTDRYRRVLPEVSRWFIRYLIPERLDQGFTSAEARAMASNEGAISWIMGMGGEPLGEPHLFGKGGEMFQLFRWTVASYRIIDAGRWSKSHVPH